MKTTVYLRIRHRIQVRPNEKIVLKDVANIIAPDELCTTLEKIPIYQVTEDDQNLIVIDGIDIIEKITQNVKKIDLQFIGPSQAIIEVLIDKKTSKPLLFLLVWMLIFIGSAVTIINFHEDVSMHLAHQKLFYIMTGVQDHKPLLFQIPYSIGLGIGMILFFNHLFKKRLNEEPSPLEVEMFNYQEAIDRYIITHENKESMKKIDEP